MAKLKWDQIGHKTYETGADHGVLYLNDQGTYDKAVVWDGLTSVNEAPSGAEPTKFYADNINYATILSAPEFGATIGCYAYPSEFSECNGESSLVPGVIVTGQRRKPFGFSYRTKIGNDSEGEDFGYKIHVIYGCLASPSEVTRDTINESPSIGEFSFEITATPVDISGVDESGKPFKPVAHLFFDSTLLTRDEMVKIEGILYGTETTTEEGTALGPRLPLPDEWKEILAKG